MKNDKEIVRIDLTKDQKEQPRIATGRGPDVIELTVAELEERITPGCQLNHNETFLVDCVG